MTKDEANKIALIDQKLDSFIDAAKPILDALNGPKGWFAQIETRMNTQENRSKMIFAIFGGAWAVVMVLVGILASNFFETLSAIQKIIAAKP